jgi:uncharacterized protein YgiM (DUF1202 family)
MKSYKKIVIFTLLPLFFLAGSAFAQRMSISVPIANIRSGPGTNYDLLWKVEKNHPIKVFGKTGAWYHFKDFENDEGWVRRDLVSDTETVIVKKDNCNVRSGPGLNNDVIFTVERGVPFQVLEKKGKWIHIRHADGDEGWIHQMLVW